MSPVNGEIGRENRAKTESARHSPEGDIVAIVLNRCAVVRCGEALGTAACLLHS